MLKKKYTTISAPVIAVTCTILVAVGLGCSMTEIPQQRRHSEVTPPRVDESSKAAPAKRQPVNSVTAARGEALSTPPRWGSRRRASVDRTAELSTMHFASFRTASFGMNAGEFGLRAESSRSSLGEPPRRSESSAAAAETDAVGHGDPFSKFESSLDLRPSLRLASFQEGEPEGTEEPAAAGDEEMDMAAMAEAINNPLGHLWLLFMQYDISFWDGDLVRAGSRKTMHTFAFQPVLPLSLTEEWKLIARPTFLINSFTAPDGFDVVEKEPEGPSFVPGSFDRESGLGDMILPLWFSARTKPPFVIGAGPTFMFPTATDDLLGTEKWSAGPSALVMYLGEEYIVGGIFQHWWDYASEDSDRDQINMTDVQFIYRYRLTQMTNIGGSPNIQYNWDTDEATIPLAIGGDTMIKIGPAPMRIGVEFQYFAAQPDIYGPEWMIRFIFMPIVPAPAFAKTPLFGG